MIEIKDLTKTFSVSGGDVKAVSNVNITINDGDIFGIIGLSGAGKSTLVRCINLLEKPTYGSILIDGVDITAISKKELREKRHKISMIFQGFNLLEQRTALKNVCYPLEIIGVPKAEAVKRAGDLLKTVELSGKESSYPSQLSGGQKQRVAIARALATDPSVLLCDEATSALDPNTTDSILRLLKRINEEMGVTVVMITHEMSIVRKICNRVAVLNEGNVVEYGDVKDVFLHPESEIARDLILPRMGIMDEIKAGMKIELFLEGVSPYEPIISNITVACNTPVNILHTDIKENDGKLFGSMIIQLPDDETAKLRVLNYINGKFKYKEVVL